MDWPTTDAIRVSDREGQLVRIVTDRPEIEAVASAVHRAERVGGDGRPWSHRLDLGDAGRWLYHAPTGEIARLNKQLSPMVRLAPADRARVAEILGAGG